MFSIERAPIDQKSYELGEKFPTEYNYCSKATLWGCAISEGFVSKEEYQKAMLYYGDTWSYVGD